MSNKTLLFYLYSISVIYAQDTASGLLIGHRQRRMKELEQKPIYEPEKDTPSQVSSDDDELSGNRLADEETEEEQNRSD